jgi:hypothetical protein
MSFLEGAGLEVGIGVAIGMLAGTTGTHGSARGRMTLLSAAIGLVVGFLLAGTADLSSAAGALFCGIGAAIGCLVASDVISGAGRREGGAGALGFLVGLAALIVAAISILLPALAFLLIVALVWLGVARHRRSQKKHAGLRVLR